jgi:hypothetical protein
VAVCGNIVLVVMSQTKSLPAVYHGMCTIPVLAVINLMACIVFRKVKFGHISGDGTTFKTAASLPFKAALGNNGRQTIGGSVYANGSGTVNYPMSHMTKTALSEEATGLEVVVVKGNIHDSPC